jgi:hypothetical protein
MPLKVFSHLRHDSCARLCMFYLYLLRERVDDEPSSVCFLILARGNRTQHTLFLHIFISFARLRYLMCFVLLCSMEFNQAVLILSNGKPSSKEKKISLEVSRGQIVRLFLDGFEELDTKLLYKLKTMHLLLIIFLNELHRKMALNLKNNLNLQCYKEESMLIFPVFWS